MTIPPQYELNLSGSDLCGIMYAVLDKGASFRFQARGHSMSPFIRNGDIISVAKVRTGKIRVGDVVAVLNPVNYAVIVHRVVGESEKGILLKGDNCNTADGVFACEAILGEVTRVERGTKEITFCRGPAKKLIAFLSVSGLLNKVFLPLLRRFRNMINMGRSMET